ncbi:MAG TPA: SWIM zinc finger family protein, partial [Thermoguttaceae bacterium]|nr:SWIM zinc finger family protein [Thermoguttaceae bacterium]
MSIADVFESFFSPATRNRGLAYADSQRVRIRQIDGEYVTAQVQGSRRAPYSVDIDWSDSIEGEVTATCTCPHYEDGYLCKHIWATLVEIDRKGFVGTLPTHLATILHDDPEDEGEDWDDNWDDDDTAGPEQFDAYFDQFRPHTGFQRKSPKSSWKGLLGAISDYAKRLITSESPPLWPTAKQREAWFVLNVAESLSAGHLVVDLCQRETRKTGEFGKIKKLSVRRDDMPEFADEEDGRLIERLLGNQTPDESPYSSYGYHSYRTVSRVAIRPAMHDVVLPKLCETGRFVWQIDSSLPAEEGKSIAWDDGDPWRLRLHAESDDSRQLWRLTGSVCRDTDSVPLGDVVLLLATGIVLLPDKLARFGVCGSNFGWFVTLRAQSAIEVPYADRDSLLDMLYRMPQFPEIDLPAALQVERIEGVPQGRLEIKSPKTPTYYSRDQLYANVHFVYGDHKFGLKDQASGRFFGEEGHALLRDRRKEAELLEQLLGLGLRPEAPN